MYFSRYYLAAQCSAAVILASAGTSFAQVADSWSIAGDITLSATNTDAAISNIPADGVLMSAPAIADGSRNTISASAIGASASIAYAGATDQDAAMADTVDGDISITALNLSGAVTIAGTIDGVSLGLGHDNTIAVSAVGASAQLSVVDDVLGGATVSRTLGITGDITLNAENSGTITVQTDVDGVEIAGGTRNAFTATAIGASAGVSVLAVIDDGAYASDVAIGEGGLISIIANNSGDVVLGATDDPSQPATLSGAALGADSIDGTVSMMAIGASGSISSTTVVLAGTAEPNVTFGEMTFDVVNTGNVEANVTITDASLDGKNTISTGAIGSVVSYSAKSISYAGDTLGVNGALDAVTFSSGNSGTILSAAGLSNSGIASGFGLSIALSTIGSSASFTLP